jgi:hypothetical protein
MEVNCAPQTGGCQDEKGRVVRPFVEKVYLAECFAFISGRGVARS